MILVFVIFEIFLIFFDIFSVSLIVFRTLMCAMLFFGYIFSLFSPIIGKSSISLFFNDFIIFWGCVKLTSLAWLLICVGSVQAQRAHLDSGELYNRGCLRQGSALGQRRLASNI